MAYQKAKMHVQVEFNFLGLQTDGTEEAMEEGGEPSRSKTHLKRHSASRSE